MNTLRADQVGSLLRPSGLLQARVDHAAGRLDRAGLRAEEDRAILEALQRQRDCGIDVCTDGEFRRSGFLSGFVDAVQGFARADDGLLPWHGGPPGGRRFPEVPTVIERLRPTGRIAGEESAFLRRHAPRPFKVTLPSPLLFAQVGYRERVSDRAYRTREELIDAAAAILAEEARRLTEEGVPYVQIDAPGYTHWADAAVVARYRGAGVDLDALLDAAIAGDNRILDAARAGGAIAAVHLCRGNLGGQWLAEGGYDAIAELLFGRLRCDRLLLEYDSPRAGSLRPLRFVPPPRVAVLGLVTTKSGVLESYDELLRRIDEASHILPLEQLALSPQCGFASGQMGNPLTHDAQWRKLELVACLAREVWP